MKKMAKKLTTILLTVMCMTMLFVCMALTVNAASRCTSHTWKVTQTVKPTCTSRGYEKVRCTKCGLNETRNFKPATGHQMRVTSTTKATCTKDGVQKLRCSKCGLNESKKLPKTGHLMRVTSTTKATCTSDGVQKFRCSRCGLNESKKLPKTGHTWGAKKYSTQDSRDGKMMRYQYSHTCLKCHTQELVVYGNIHYHSYKKVTGKSYKKCSCGKIISAVA